MAENGTTEQKRELGNIADLPRPWSPGTCTKPQTRADLWTWLDAVVVWINHELVFDPVDVIPACWPQHAHLVHELAVLADLRRRAELAPNSDTLEEWHRYAIPAFLERMRHRIADHCGDTHPGTWPSSGRFNRYLSDESTAARKRAFANDLANVDTNSDRTPGRPHLWVVERATGEILD